MNPSAVMHASYALIQISGDMSAGDLLVGIATLALAALTYSSVRVSRQILEASDAPLLIGAHVPKDSPGLVRIIHQTKATAIAFDPPFAGVLPFQIKTTGEPQSAFVMRLWNVGRGPALIKDVRLSLDGTVDVTPATQADAVVTPGGISDQSWTNLTLPGEIRNKEISGTLRILYEHPNGHLLQTVQQVKMEDGHIYFQTIKRSRARRCAIRERQVCSQRPQAAVERTT